MVFQGEIALSMRSAVQPKMQPVRAIWRYTPKVFVVSAGLILAITGLAKIWSAFGDAKALGLVDPIIGVKFGPLMMAAGFIEVAIAFVCWFSKRWATKYLLLAWLATFLTAYRIAIWYVDWRPPCSCLGSFTDSLQISPQLADSVMKGVLAYLGIGAFSMYMVQWAQNRKLHLSKS